MFSFFTKSPPFKVADKIWKDDHFALRGLATEALKAITRNEVPVILSFFDQSKERVIAFLESQNAPCFNLNPQTVNALGNGEKMIFCANAFEYEFILKNSSLNKSNVCFLFESHYPIINPESVVLNNLHALTGAKFFTFCLSLDNQLFKVFGNDNLKSMMGRLGFKDDECIEHAMVSKSIVRAREKIDQSIVTEIKTTSEEDWYLKNVRKV